MDTEDKKLWGSDVELPSKGILYEDKLPDGKVTVTPMGTFEEKILGGTGRSNANNMINTLIERCVPTLKENSIPVSNLVLGDRLYLMMCVRATSYGTDYRFQVTCEQCSLRFNHTVNMPDDFEVFRLPPDFTEPFEVDLPHSKARVGLRLIRGKDEAAIEKWLDQIYKKIDRQIQGDPAFSYRLARQIVYIENPDTGSRLDDSDKDFNYKKEQFVETLLGHDLRAIRQTLADNECGPNTEIEIPSCPKCNHINVIGLPVTNEFFRPGSQRRAVY